MPPMMRAIRPILLLRYSGDAVLELADLLDPELDRLARSQEALARHTDARRCAGHDQIARLQRDARGEHLDLLGHREDHLVGVRILHQLAAHPKLEAELLRIADLRRRHDPRPERTRAVEALLAHPVEMERPVGGIVRPPHDVARRKIVADGVAEYVVERLR